jgi:hypothetical protein
VIFLAQNMRVNDYRFEVAMAQQFLNSENAIPPNEQVDGEGIGKTRDF